MSNTGPKLQPKALVINQTFNKRIPFRYMVIIRNGEDWREFDDLDLMCDLMGLDKTITKRHFDLKGYYTGYEFTVFRVRPENKSSHRGHFY